MSRALLVVLILTACESVQRTEPAAELAGRVGTDSITLAEVDARVQADEPETWQTLYQARSRALQAIVDDRLITAEARREGIGTDSLLAREIAARVKPIDEAEVTALYEQNRNQMGGRTLEEMRGQLRNYLAASAARRAGAGYVADLAAVTGVKVLAPFAG